MIGDQVKSSACARVFLLVLMAFCLNCGGGGGKTTTTTSSSSSGLEAPSVTLSAYLTSGKPGYQASTQDQGSGATYQWTLTSGVITSGQGSPRITFTPGKTGALIAKVDVSKNGTNASGSATATVVAAASASIFAQPEVHPNDGPYLASVPGGEGVTVQWTIGGGSANGSLTNPILSYQSMATPGTYTLHASVRNLAGDAESSTRTLQVASGLALKDVGTMAPRRGFTTTRLRDGRLLVVGGRGRNPFERAHAELYDPVTQAWGLTAGLPIGRGFHTASLLKDGRVLITGGYDRDADAGVTPTALLYDPATHTWREAASMGAARVYHSATVLSNGKVLVAGGTVNTLLGPTYDSGEIYDPASNSWSPTRGHMVSPRFVHSAILLANGKVLVSGGRSGSGSTTTLLRSSELYDPVSDTWAGAASMGASSPANTSFLLEGGKVFMIHTGQDTKDNRAEVYDPATNLWTPTGGPTLQPLAVRAAELLDNGKVLVAYSSSATGAPPFSETYDPKTNTWSTAGAPQLPSGGALLRAHANPSLLPVPLGDGRVRMVMTWGGGWEDCVFDPARTDWTAGSSVWVSRGGHTAITLGDGRIMVAGGSDPHGRAANVDVYDPARKIWSTAGQLAHPRIGHATALLGNGMVLVAGGYTAAGIGGTAELYDPVANAWSAVPDMFAKRSYPTATPLATGKVLVLGGWHSGTYGLYGQDFGELFDPATRTWSPVPGAPNAQAHTATRLANGSVLVVGLENGRPMAQRYDPASKAWTTVALPNFGRSYHTATLLPDGRVLVVGGGEAPAPGSAEIYDPATNAWTATGTLTGLFQGGHAASLLSDGRVMISGGVRDQNLDSANVEVYDPSTNTWTLSKPMVNARKGHTSTAFGNGGAIIFGGSEVLAPEIWR